jgi:hypothetical protein
VWKKLRRLLPGPADAILEESGLTDQQKKFCLEKAQGATSTQAALASHECATGDSAKSLGCELMKDERVIDCVNGPMAVHGPTRGYRISKLKTHVDNRDPDVSLKALDMSFKLDDSYPSKQHIDVDVRVASLDDIELSRRLAALLEKLPLEQIHSILDRQPIDITPKEEGEG